VEDDRYVAFGQKLSGEEGSVRWPVLMMQQPVLMLPKCEVKSSHILTQSS
jgi:hypothetical protein